MRKDEDKDGAINTRTLILGGVFYIITHAIVSTPGNPLNLYKHYILYFLILDAFVMGIIYKQYYGRTILKELNEYETDKFDESKHKYTQNKKISKNTTEEENNESFEDQKAMPNTSKKQKSKKTSEETIDNQKENDNQEETKEI